MWQHISWCRWVQTSTFRFRGDTVASSSSASTLSAQKPQLYSVLWDLEKQLQGHTTYDSITSITTLARLDDILTSMWMKTRLWWLTTDTLHKEVTVILPRVQKYRPNPLPTPKPNPITLKKRCYIALKVVLWLVVIGEPLFVLYRTKSWCFSGSSAVLWGD